MFVYPPGVDVSGSGLRFLTARLREHRRALGTRWRRLNAGRQALLTLAHLRNGQPYAQLAAGFGTGTTTTAYRYIAEAVNLLAALAPTRTEAAPSDVDEGVRDPGRDAPAHRPNRRRDHGPGSHPRATVAHFLWEIQERPTVVVEQMASGR